MNYKKVLTRVLQSTHGLLVEEVTLGKLYIGMTKVAYNAEMPVWPSVE